MSFFISCEFLPSDKKKVLNTVFVDTTINYNAVDTYPLLKNCNPNEETVQRNQCFETELIKLIQLSLIKNKIASNHSITDTVYMDILIDNLGVFSVAKIYKNEFVFQEIPELDSILRQTIHQLPKAIQPSLKRGTPVSVLFKLPVAISLKQ